LRLASADPLKSWAAFIDLCALLAPTPKGAVPARDDEDWELIVRIASEHSASPAVWRAVEHAAAAPEEVKNYFCAIFEINAARNRMMLAGLDALLALFDAHGVRCVVLKGGANIASGLYNDPGERFLSDLDVLVAPGQIETAERLLRAHGYTDMDPEAPRRWFTMDRHLPPLVPPTGGFAIEVHTSLVSSKRLETLVPAAAMLQRAIAVQWNGRSILIPHPTDAVIYNIVHAQLHHELQAHGVIELRQLRDLALLAARHRDAVDWSEVERRFAGAGFAHVLAEQAAISRVLMGVALPVGEQDAQAAMDRLRASMLTPAKRPFGGVWRELADIYIGGFLRDPKLAVNLLNPRWWPQRIGGIRAFFRRGNGTP
jgi:hypothetical protein